MTVRFRGGEPFQYFSISVSFRGVVAVQVVGHDVSWLVARPLMRIMKSARLLLADNEIRQNLGKEERLGISEEEPRKEERARYIPPIRIAGDAVVAHHKTGIPHSPFFR